jgi:DNA-binding response OmpR family regulator
MDGYKASQLIRASEAVRRQPPMPIVAITAGSVTKANDATAYQEAGMNELIHKPFNNAKLTAIFNKCIRREGERGREERKRERREGRERGERRGERGEREKREREERE